MMKTMKFLCVCSMLSLLCFSNIYAGAIRSGFNDNTLPRNDDGSTALVSIGFSVNFFGNSYDQLYVNNNGNVTFDDALFTFTPFDLTSTNRVILAPFFADVDTRASGSQEVTYSFGAGTVNGRDAFGVNWINVGYFAEHDDKLNSFQLVIIDRSDTGAGNFDFEFNHDTINWETGDLSGGTGGLGGFSARSGYSNGTGDAGTFFELVGSAVNGAFLDSNNITGLIHNSFNSDVLGRYVFQVRGEVVLEEGIVLSPEAAVNELGTQHTVTATIQNNLGEFVEGRSVIFTIVSGPHAGEGDSDTTDSNGEATFTYTGTTAGTDTIEASFVDNKGATVISNQVTKTWEIPVVPTPTPEPTPSPTPEPTPSPSPTPVPSPTEPPTAIELAYFHAKAGKGGRVTLTWETVTEVDNAGFNLYRSKRRNGHYTQVNNAIIPAQSDAVSGASYRYIDTPGKGTFYYKLGDVDYYGKITMHGPEKVRVGLDNTATKRRKRK